MKMIGLNNEARKRVGWSTIVPMGNHMYIKIGDEEIGLREWLDNINQEVLREVVQKVLYEGGETIVWTCLEEYRDGLRVCQWDVTVWFPE